MSIKLIVTSGSVPAGSYVATVNGVEKSQSKLGPGLRWSFTVASGAYTGQKLTAFTGEMPTPQNKAGRFAAGVAGKPISPGMELDMGAYYGQTRLVVVESTDSGSARVVSVSTLPT
jgi:hypothetical protein